MLTLSWQLFLYIWRCLWRFIDPRLSLFLLVGIYASWFYHRSAWWRGGSERKGRDCLPCVGDLSALDIHIRANVKSPVYRTDSRRLEPSDGCKDGLVTRAWSLYVVSLNVNNMLLITNPPNGLQLAWVSFHPFFFMLSTIWFFSFPFRSLLRVQLDSRDCPPVSTNNDSV